MVSNIQNKVLYCFNNPIELNKIRKEVEGYLQNDGVGQHSSLSDDQRKLLLNIITQINENGGHSDASLSKKKCRHERRPQTRS